MTPHEGAARLVFHCQPNRGSFLGMLRPFVTLDKTILMDLFNALRQSASLISAGTISRELAAALWTLSFLSRSWALDDQGMLRRNALITEPDRLVLAEFLRQFDYAVMMLLDGSGELEAFSSSTY